jgi:hypothetical protein
MIGTALALVLAFAAPQAQVDDPPPIGQAYIFTGGGSKYDSWCISPSLRLVWDPRNGPWVIRTDGMPLDDPYECSHYYR